MSVSAGERTEMLVGVLPLLWEEDDYLLSCCVRAVMGIRGGLMLCDWAQCHSADGGGLCKMLWVWRGKKKRGRGTIV